MIHVYRGEGRAKYEKFRQEGRLYFVAWSLCDRITITSPVRKKALFSILYVVRFLFWRVGRVLVGTTNAFLPIVCYNLRSWTWA